MTKQEAIEYIKAHCNPDYPKEDGTQWVEAMNMAIEALESQERQELIVGSYLLEEPSCSEEPNRSDLVKESGDLVNDCISRQGLLDAMCDFYCDSKYPCANKCKTVRMVEDFPPVQPEIIRCKDCKRFEECDKVMFWYGEDDFCSRAERRTDG